MAGPVTEKGPLAKYGPWILAGSALLGLVLLSPLLRKSAEQVGSPFYVDGSQNSEAPYGLEQAPGYEKEEGLMDPDAEAAKRYKASIDAAKKARETGAVPVEASDVDLAASASATPSSYSSGYSEEGTERRRLTTSLGSGGSGGGGGGGGGGFGASGRGITTAADGGGAGAQTGEAIDHRPKDADTGKGGKGMKALENARNTGLRAVTQGNVSMAAAQSGQAFGGNTAKQGYSATGGNDGKARVSGLHAADLKGTEPKATPQNQLEKNVPEPKKDDFKKNTQSEHANKGNDASQTIDIINKLVDFVKTLLK